MTKGHTSVMASRKAVPKEAPPWAKLEFFPTPPWATRALIEDVLGVKYPLGSVWEPCAGLGHMSSVLAEYFREVRATDIFAYPLPWGVDKRVTRVEPFDFLDPTAVRAAPEVDWIITNPPFSKATDVLNAALTKARFGVALLVRVQWLESAARYSSVFAERGPIFIAPFVERVPMCEGGWDPQGSTATQYAWFVWLKGGSGWLFTKEGQFGLNLVRPGRADLRARPSDAATFGARHVPGWIAPSRLKKAGRDQIQMEF